MASRLVRYDLHPKQLLCHNSTATEILYGGAAGGGKSHTIRVEAIFYAYEIPGIQIYIFRRTSPELTRNYLTGPASFHEMLAAELNTGAVRFVQKPSPTFKFSNGSAIYLCHCHHEHDVFAYQGAEFHILMVDELTHFTHSIYAYLRGRVRVADSSDEYALNIPLEYRNKVPFILAASNPGGVGHSWVKNDFVDIQEPLAISQMPDEQGGFRRQYIPAKLSDNPSLDAKKYASTLSGLGSAELVRAMLEGDWNIVAGGMFDDVFDPDKHILPSNLSPDVGWAVWRSYDYGASKPWCVLWLTQVQDGFHCDDRYIPHGAVIAFAELYGVQRNNSGGFRANVGNKATPIMQAHAIMDVEISLGLAVDDGYADPSIFAKTQAQQEMFMSIADIFSECGVEWQPASNSRKTGWVLIRYMLEGKDGIPMLYFTKACAHLIRLLPQMPRDKVDSEDIDTDAEDHAVDALRYGLLSKFKPEGVSSQSEDFRKLRAVREKHNYLSRFDPTYIPFDYEVEGGSPNQHGVALYRETKKRARL